MSEEQLIAETIHYEVVAIDNPQGVRVYGIRNKEFGVMEGATESLGAALDSLPKMEKALQQAYSRWHIEEERLAKKNVIAIPGGKKDAPQ